MTTLEKGREKSEELFTASVFHIPDDRAAVELHWRRHLAEAWDGFDEGQRGRIIEALRSAPADATLETLGFEELLPPCPWHRDPVIERVLEAGDELAWVPPRCLDATWSNGTIDSVEPRIACAGELVRVRGTFPAVQDPAITVLFADTGPRSS